VSVQYRVAFAKKDEVVEGPDDAAVVITIAAADCALAPAVAYMQGKLKAAGHTGTLLGVLASGEAETALRRLSVR
jgi:hypothetical protein